MSGALWAITAGVGFGLFQTFNRRAVKGMDVYVATFIQLVVSTIVLLAIALLTEDVRALLAAPFSVWVNFALAGTLHFFIGWTFLNASQKRIGAARTSPLIGTTPLFATVIAAVTLREFPGFWGILGVGLIVLGAYVISQRSGDSKDREENPQPVKAGLQASWLGLSAAFCWALSPIFIRAGLEDLPSPLLGVTWGIAFSALAYGIVLLWQRNRWLGSEITGDAWMFKLLAGLLVGLSTWVRWIALDLAPVAIVIALTMVSVPLVILLSPLISGKHMENVTVSLWVGAGLILCGALMLTLIA
jgi:drug/metabolite transporter (DMT)-like permease